MSGLNTENCDTNEVFKDKKYANILKENAWEFAWDRGWKGFKAVPTQSSDTFSVKFLVF